MAVHLVVKFVNKESHNIKLYSTDKICSKTQTHHSCYRNNKLIKLRTGKLYYKPMSKFLIHSNADGFACRKSCGLPIYNREGQ